MATVCVGCGLEVDEASGLLQVDVDGTSITCGAAGLQANFPAALVGSNCIDVVGGAVSVNLSTDACNGIECRANGLYAPCPDSIIVGDNFDATGNIWPFEINTGGSATFNADSLCSAPSTCGGPGNQSIHVCNTTCCGVAGFATIIASVGNIDNASVGFAATVFLSTQVDGTGWTVATPFTEIRMGNDGAAPAGNRNLRIGTLIEKNFLSLAAGACTDYQSRVTIVVTSGTATWATQPNFEFYFDLNQVGCC